MASLLIKCRSWIILASLMCLLACSVPGESVLIEAQNRSISTRIPCTFSVPSTNETKCDTTLQQIFRVLSVSDESILLGSAECLYLLDTNLTMTSSIPIKGSLSCTNDDFACKNYITAGTHVSATSFRVCGTYDTFTPQCWDCQLNSENSLECDGMTANEAMPRTPNQNFTAIVGKSANDEDFVGRAVLDTGKLLPKFTRLVKPSNDEVNTFNDWFTTPLDFVGEPIEYEAFTYFFFREKAAEVTIEAVIYSRVARICTADAGGDTNPLSGEFTTFLKARLACSRGDQYPFFYNEVQDMKQSSNDASIIYGLFTTPNAGPVNSAVCRYNLQELDSLFNQDNRRGQTMNDVSIDDTKAWDPITIHADDTESQRNCSTPYDFRNNNIYTYIESFPLINTNAKNCGLGQTCDDYSRSTDDPLAVFPGVHGSQLEVYNDNDTYLMVAIGTNDRSVLIVDITSTEAVIRDTIFVCSADLSDTQKVEKKWPYGVSYLQIHQASLYGAVDNCAFKYSLDGDEPTFLNIRLRSEPQNYTYAQNLSDSVTGIFKLFEASPGVQMDATFTGELADHNCSQTRFETAESEFLHVHCELRNITVNAASLEGVITVTSQSGLADPLTVTVTINIDSSREIKNSSDKAEAKRHDKEIASFKYKHQQWLQENVTCNGDPSSQCPGATTCEAP